MTDAVELTALRISAGDRELVRGVDVSLAPGRVTALVGSSGSGKTLTARALLGMVDLEPGVTAGELLVRVDGRDHTPYRGLHRAPARARDRAFRSIRGRLLGYLPQHARQSLDPLFSVGSQVHRSGGGVEHLRRAGLPDAERVARLYPHELSGGMAQRVVIAQALAQGSRFLVADEPTTGLDPTVQVAILRSLRDLTRDGLGLLLITHDLRILPDLADELLVMADGRVVERTAPDAIATGEVSSEMARDLLNATRRVDGGRLG